MKKLVKKPLNFENREIMRNYFSTIGLTPNLVMKSKKRS